jgi:hypothetical protein
LLDQQNTFSLAESVLLKDALPPNGYHLQVGDMNQATEGFLSTGRIWRVCQALLHIVDLIWPIESS